MVIISGSNTKAGTGLINKNGKFAGQKGIIITWLETSNPIIQYP